MNHVDASAARPPVFIVGLGLASFERKRTAR